MRRGEVLGRGSQNNPEKWAGMASSMFNGMNKKERGALLKRERLVRTTGHSGESGCQSLKNQFTQRRGVG